MAANEPGLSSSPVGQNCNKSKFTYRDLRLLGQSSVASPLRVIALVDFDAFYAQCESVRLGLPESQPLGVQQFNWVIALNYPAKNSGLKRPCSPDDAKLGCPDIVLQHVATWREGETGWAYRTDNKEHMNTDKAALDPYRLESRRALEVVRNFLPKRPSPRVEKASIDEIFVDLSAQVHAQLLERFPELLARNPENVDSSLPQPWSTLLDWKSDKLVSATLPESEIEPPDWDDVALNLGAEIVRDLRAEIYERLRYTCSAGIARNKVLAKLGAGHNKPNQQTVIRARAIGAFLATYNFTKMRGLGGDGGQSVKNAFGTESISDLLQISLEEMKSRVGEDFGQWVYNAIRGEEYAEVVSRTQIKSMLTAKTFPGSLQGRHQAEKWLRIFAQDLVARIADLNAEESPPRRPTTITLHHSSKGRFGPTRTKQKPIPLTATVNEQVLYMLAQALLTEFENEGPVWPCLTISLGVSKLVDCITANHHITTFFSRAGTLDGGTASSEEEDSSTTDTQEAEPAAKRRKMGAGQPPFAATADGESEVAGKRTALSNEGAQSQVGSSNTRAGQRAEPDPPPSSQQGYHCPNCGNAIPESDVLEHLDWHVAMDIQKNGSFTE